jgi:hypothetical protein
MSNTQVPKPRAGGCQCGAVQYEISGPLRRLFVCHCRECQKQSASAFAISAMFRSTGMRHFQGELHRWSRRTDSGEAIVSFFCPVCGSRVWDGDLKEVAEVCIKGGSLDEPLDLTDAVHIWTCRKLAGVIIPDRAQQYPGEPE